MPSSVGWYGLSCSIQHSASQLEVVRYLQKGKQLYLILSNSSTLGLDLQVWGSKKPDSCRVNETMRYMHPLCLFV